MDCSLYVGANYSRIFTFVAYSIYGVERILVADIEKNIKMRKIIFALVLLLSLAANAQIKTPIFTELGTEFPLNYSVGLGSDIDDDFQINLRAGILTKPYDGIILNTLAAIGVDETIKNTVGDAFAYGLALKGGVNYRFAGFYTGVFYSFYHLTAVDVPTDLINNYFDINLPPISSFDLIEYKLKSDLHNIGLLIGKTFPINEQFEVATEFSVGKTIASKNSLSNTYEKEMLLATEIIHNELNPLFKKYGYLPSLNIFLRFKL